MAGSHIEREARYETSKMTPLQLDQTIWKLHHLRWSQRKIAAAVGMTQPAVKYRIDALLGKQRKRSTYRMCGGICGENFPTDKLNSAGLCAECAEDQ